MKKAVTMMLVSLFFIIGCQDDNSLLQPENDLSGVTLDKGRPILLGDTEDARKLELSDDLTNYHVNYSQNFTINGAKGGRISIKHQWKDTNGKLVWLQTELWIPKGAFKGSMNFDMIFDLENYAMELYPSPFTFDKPVELSMYWYGLDLSSYAEYDVDFNYLDGIDEIIKYDYTNLDIENGILIIEAAQLNHFSRYGWTRTRR